MDITEKVEDHEDRLNCLEQEVKLLKMRNKKEIEQEETDSESDSRLMVAKENMRRVKNYA